MIIYHFFFSIVAIAGFTLVLNIPRKHIFSAAFIGACSWTVYIYFANYVDIVSPMVACFIGACVISFMSEAFAKIFKDTATLFIIPGIFPLVPGIGMYETIRFALTGDMASTAQSFLNTMFSAGSLAIGLLIGAALMRMIFSIASKISLAFK